jgi:hypothetical protein
MKCQTGGESEIAAAVIFSQQSKGNDLGAYTITRKQILAFEQLGTATQSDMIVREDGLADLGILDYNFCMLQGNVSIQ